MHIRASRSVHAPFRNSIRNNDIRDPTRHSNKWKRVNEKWLEKNEPLMQYSDLTCLAAYPSALHRPKKKTKIESE